MYCRICGSRDDSVEYYGGKLQALCKYCAETTPDKVSRSEFEQYYWDGNPLMVHPAIRKEFYDDYLSSQDSLEQYKKDTTKEF